MLMMDADGSQLGHEAFEVPVDGATLKIENSIIDAFAFRSGMKTHGHAVDDAEVFRDFIDINATGFEEPFPTTPTSIDGISDPVRTNAITITKDGYLPLLTYYIDMDRQTVPEHPPSDLNLPTIEQIAQALAALPVESRDRIERVDVQGSPRFDRSDAYLKIDDGHVRVFPGGFPSTTERVLGGLVHETAHAIDGENRLGEFESIRWLIAMPSNRIDASAYARSGLGEDVAETYRLYKSVRGSPDESEGRSLMPQRFALLDEMLA